MLIKLGDKEAKAREDERGEGGGVLSLLSYQKANAQQALKPNKKWERQQIVK